MTTYDYLPVPVVDPASGDIPFNATGTIHTPGDLTTPLTVTVDGVPMTTLQVTAGGYMPGFSIDDVSGVYWVSGAYQVPLTPSGPPVPVGGLAGQGLIKTSDLDHAIGWGNPAATVSSSGITDATAIGQQLLIAPDAPTARSVTGAAAAEQSVMYVDYDTAAGAWPDRPQSFATIKVIWVGGTTEPPGALASDLWVRT